MVWGWMQSKTRGGEDETTKRRRATGGREEEGRGRGGGRGRTLGWTPTKWGCLWCEWVGRLEGVGT